MREPKTKSARKTSTQENRIGKKLVGAWVKEEDIAKLKALLKANGLTMQSFFSATAELVIRPNDTKLSRDKLVNAATRQFRKNLLQSLDN